MAIVKARSPRQIALRKRQDYEAQYQHEDPKFQQSPPTAKAARVPDFWPTITRNVNKWLKERGSTHRGKFSCVGSFFAFRVDDPDGTMTVKLAHDLEIIVRHEMKQAGLKFREKQPGAAYHFAGVVINWEQA